MSIKIKPFVFLILNGWGIAPPSSANAISQSKTPNFNRLAANYKVFSLESAGNSVGLTINEPGNSQVGYMTIGAGKTIYQMLPKINVAIRDRTFFDNPALNKAILNCRQNDSALHLIGQISKSEEHSSLNHLLALIDLARSKEVEKIYLHLILSGEDLKDSQDNLSLIEKIQEHLEKIGVGEIASLSGQYYGMDRDGHWDRTQKFYEAIVGGQGEIKNISPTEIVKEFLENDIANEKILPTLVSLSGKPKAKIENGDSLIGFNYRSDRMRQIFKALIDPEFKNFETKKLDSENFIGFVKYCPDIEMNYAFSKDEVTISLAKIIDNKKIEQVYFAEIDRLAQLSAFLRNNYSGKNISDIGLDENKIAKRAIKEIVDDKIDFAVVNFSMADKLADEGDFKKTIKAIEKIDDYIGKISKVVLEKKGALVLVSTHANLEEFSSLQSGAIKKENSTNPVPFLIAGDRWGEDEDLVEGGVDLSLLKPSGNLADVAPTILKILDIKKPSEMTGKSLI